MTSGDVLTRRALNRATLARQNLLERSGDVVGTIEHLVGMQAQNPLDPYFALWSRVEAFDPDELGRLLLDRDAVRAQLMRGTIHLVTAVDFGRLEPVFRPVLARVFGSTQFAKDIAAVDRDELLELAKGRLDEEPIGRAELGRFLGVRWPDVTNASLAQAGTYLVPVVQTTPRGVWGSKGSAKWASADSWLGRKRGPASSVRDLALRYLNAFGPASVSDMRNWSGLTGLKDVFAELRPRLRVWRSEDGAELFDLADAEHPDVDTPAPPRLLPEYDNLLLGHADRSRFFDGAVPPGWVGSVLVDGRYGGWWRHQGSGPATGLFVDLAVNVSRGDKVALETEAGRLLEWMGGDAGNVRLARQ